MARKLSISKYDNGDLIKSNDSISFKIKCTLYGRESQSSFLKFKVPPYPKLITKSKLTFTKKIESIIEYDNNNVHRPSSCKVYRQQPKSISNTKYNADFLLTSPPKTIAVNDNLIFTASPSSVLSPLNNYLLQVISVSGKQLYTTILGSNPIGPQTYSLVPSVNSVREKLTNNKKTLYTFKIDNSNNRINKPTVKDVLVFTFTRTQESANTTQQKYLLKGNLVKQNELISVSEKTPPNYLDIEYATLEANLNGGLATATTQDGLTVVNIYAAWARYFYINNAWTGEWLQVDSNNNVIWGKAEEQK